MNRQQVELGMVDDSPAVCERVRGAQQPNDSPKPFQRQQQPNIMQQFQQYNRARPLNPHLLDNGYLQQQQSPAFSPPNSPGQQPNVDVNSDEYMRMLICLENGEQRLITFVMPQEIFTVTDLLEQVGVPFNADTYIECIVNPGSEIDYIVNVGDVTNAVEGG